MPIDTTAPQSPGWWLARLFTRLGDNRSRYDLLDSYYTGEAGIPVQAARATREAYRRLMSMAHTNFAELVVEATRERMVPIAFRTGADDDATGDGEAWRIWQANSLDADSGLVHRTSLSLGDSYVIVGGVDDEIGAPLITAEDPREVVVEFDPVRRRKVVAALKVFTDEIAGRDTAYLYLPGIVARAVAPQTSNPGVFDAQSWEWVDSNRLPAPVVPVVPFPNRSNLFRRSFGEFETHLGILNRINYTVLNRVEITTLQAFRQRAVKGVPEIDDAGNPVDYSDVFAADPGAMWLLPETAEMWESGVVDLNPIRQAIRDDVQDLAAVTRTPLFYLTPDANNGSAEGASLAREGLVFKTLDRIGQAAEAWEQVMSLAFTFAGDTLRASRRDMECVFASPERFSLAERYDAASKAIAAGVPWRSVMGDVLQFSPQQIDRMESERAGDALLSAALAPTAAPAAPAAPETPGVPDGV
jgi:hypothetical protein